jgi:hypothetical protein
LAPSKVGTPAWLVVMAKTAMVATCTYLQVAHAAVAPAALPLYLLVTGCKAAMSALYRALAALRVATWSWQLPQVGYLPATHPCKQAPRPEAQVAGWRSAAAMECTPVL